MLEIDRAARIDNGKTQAFNGQGTRRDSLEVLLCQRQVSGFSELHSRLPKGVGVSKERIRKWISEQEVGRYMQTEPPREIFSYFTEDRPNNIHQADLLYLPHDKVGRKTYKHVLMLVDVASRFNAARPLTSKLAEVAKAFSSIYKLLTWPMVLMV